MRRTRRRLLLTTALAPLLVLATGCSDAGDQAEAGGGPKTTAPDRKEPAEPLNADALRSALLTGKEAAEVDFHITGSDARTGAVARPEVETTLPADCLTLRRAGSENAPGRGETAAAWSVLYPGPAGRTDGDGFPRYAVLTSYPVKTARARMDRLREAVADCDRFDARNPYGTSSQTTETLKVPDLGEDAVRFRLSARTKSRTGHQGLAYDLVTVVRTGGVITSVRTSVVLGDVLSPDAAAEFRPQPGPDEPAVAALVEKAAEAEMAAPAP